LASALVEGAIQSRASMRLEKAARMFFTMASARFFSEGGKCLAT